MENYEKFKEDMILRDHLALDRTILANERTFLAYMRTAIGLIAAGVGFIKFIDVENMLIVNTGYAVCVVAIAVAIYGAMRYRKVSKKLASISQEVDK